MGISPIKRSLSRSIPVGQNGKLCLFRISYFGEKEVNSTRENSSIGEGIRTEGDIVELGIHWSPNIFSLGLWESIAHIYLYIFLLC